MTDAQQPDLGFGETELTARQKAKDAKEIARLVEEIYSAYPRKRAPGYAVTAINKAVRDVSGSTGKSKVDAAKWLLEMTKLYASRETRPKEFVAYPASWFNGKCYNEDPKDWGAPKRMTLAERMGEA